MCSVQALAPYYDPANRFKSETRADSFSSSASKWRRYGEGSVQFDPKIGGTGQNGRIFLVLYTLSLASRLYK